MPVLKASDNGGRYNTIHRQTDDGMVFSVAHKGKLLPISFRYSDYLGDFHETLISASFYPHLMLMRKDCGEQIESDGTDYSFSWTNTTKHITGFNEAPSGEYQEAWYEEYDCAEDVLVEGLSSRRSILSRKDREYWTPGITLRADSVGDIFAAEEVGQTNSCCNNDKRYKVATFLQRNPITCPPEQPDKCGILKYKGDK